MLDSSKNSAKDAKQYTKKPDRIDYRIA